MVLSLSIYVLIIISCVLQNSPKYIACLKEEQELQFQYKVHTSLDIVEEKLLAPGKVSGDLRELYLGLLYSTEEQKMYPLSKFVGLFFIVSLMMKYKVYYTQ